MGFQLPAFTPSLILKIVSITGAFLKGGWTSVLGRVGAMQSDLISQINPVTYTAPPMAIVTEPGQSLLHGVHVCVCMYSNSSSPTWGDEKKPFHKDTNNATSID